MNPAAPVTRIDMRSLCSTLQFTAATTMKKDCGTASTLVRQALFRPFPIPSELRRRPSNVPSPPLNVGRGTEKRSDGGRHGLLETPGEVFQTKDQTPLLDDLPQHRLGPGRE